MKIRDLVIQVRLNMGRATKELRELDKLTMKVGKSLAGAGKEAIAFGAEVVSGSRKAVGGLESVSKAGSGLLGTLGKVGGVAASAFREVGGAAVGAAEKAIKFESAMADVAKVVPGLRDESGKVTAEFDKMKGSIFALSSEIAIAPEGFAKIIAAAGQAGIAREELERFAGDAAKMAVAFDTNADKAGDAMAKMRTGLGMSQDEVFQLAGQFNYLGQKMAVTGGQLVDVTKRVGAMAKGAGLGTDQMAALSATMIASGANTSVAATGIKNFSLTLAAGEAATNRQRVAYERLGLDATEVAKSFTAGGAETEKTIKGVLTAIKGLDKAEQSATLMQLFGKESIGAIAPLLENMDKLGEAFDLVADKEKALKSINDEYTTRAATTENAIQLLSNRLDIAAIKIGDALLPALNELIAFVSSPEATAMGDALVGGIKDGLEFLIGAVREALPVVMGFVNDARAALSGFVEGLRGFIDPIGDALGPLFTSIVELGGKVLEVLGLAGDEGQAFGEKVGSSFGDTAVKAIEALTSVINGMVGALETIEPVLSPVVAFLKGTLGAALETVGDLAKFVGEQVTSVTEAFRAFTAGNFAEGFAKIGDALLNALVTPFKIVARQLVDLADAIPGGSELVPAAVRRFAGKTAVAGISEMVGKATAAGAAAVAEQEAAPMAPSRASLQGGNLSEARRKQLAQSPEEARAETVAELQARLSAATTKAEKRALRQALRDAGEMVPEPGRGGGGGGRGKKGRPDRTGVVTDPDVLRTLYESPAETRQRLRQEKDARRGMKGANALDAAVMASVSRGNVISGGSDRATSSVGPSVTNMYNTFNFDIDARGNEGAAANVERAARAGSRAFERGLRGADSAAMRARAGGGTAAGAG